MNEQEQVERDEFRNFTPEAKQGILMIRGLSDETVLAAARNEKSAEHAQLMAAMGEGTNPTWITARCAETAYDRELIDEQELDWLTR